MALRSALPAAVLAFGACTTRSDSAAGSGDTATAAATGAAATAPDTGMAAMGGTTGNPDQDFLRMMSDHHKGLILMAHETMEGTSKSTGAVRDEARTLDKKQDAELDSMVTMLEQSFKDPYAPKVMPDNQAMVDSLMTKSGAAYDRTFRENVIKHHQAGIGMINQYLPRLTRPELKTMAERMKADQTREIAELQRKLGRG